MNTYRVYIHYKSDTNEPFYIGRASHSWRPRQQSGRNPYWTNTAEKHGFTIKVIGGTWTKNYASKVEKKLIKLYSRKFNLTNMTHGGDGCPGLSHGEKAKKAMSDKRKGKSHSQEWCNMISKSLLLRYKNGAMPSSTFYTEESLRKLSEAGKRKKGKPNKLSRKVICHTDNKIYECCASAAEAYGTDRGNLGKHLDRHKYHKTIKGRTFSWLPL